MLGSKAIYMLHGTLYHFDLIGYQIIIRVEGNPLHPSINKFITESETNITEIHHYFDCTKEDAVNSSVILAFNNFEINFTYLLEYYKVSKILIGLLHYFR